MCILFRKLLHTSLGKTHTRRERERERERESSPRKASGVDFGAFFTWILFYFSKEGCILFEKLLHFFPGKPILEERDRERGRSPRKASGIDFGTHFTWILLLLFMRNVHTF